MTNTVSLYLAAGSDLQHARNLAKRELAGSRSVKSDWTRTEVETAWRQILVYLNDLKEVPPKGLIIFASSSEFEVIEPPVPNRSNIYKCGSTFFREPLEAMYDEAAGEKTGLILIDSNGGSISWFRGDTVIPLWEEDSMVLGKHRMGGQSQARFQRGHDEQIKTWLRKVADMANQTLLPMGVTNLLVGGPAFMKHRLVEDGHLDYRFQILGFADCGYTDPIAGAREALFRWKDSNTSRAY